MNLILLGAPGAGKGTQAEVISKKFNLAHISTGELFRKALAAGDELGQMAKSFMERGELVPDEIVLKIVVENLPSDRGCLFDGFPRNANQARILDQMLSAKKGIDVVVNVDVEIPALIERLLSRGRSDDNRETIQNRLKVYTDQTQPLINYYAEQGKLAQIDGNGTVEQVTQAIEAEIRKKS
jgi:adenylate kinase